MMLRLDPVSLYNEEVKVNRELYEKGVVFKPEVRVFFFVSTLLSVFGEQSRRGRRPLQQMNKPPFPSL